jgi:hypothetical protein
MVHDKIRSRIGNSSCRHLGRTNVVKPARKALDGFVAIAETPSDLADALPSVPAAEDFPEWRRLLWGEKWSGP